MAGVGVGGGSCGAAKAVVLGVVWTSRRASTHADHPFVHTTRPHSPRRSTTSTARPPSSGGPTGAVKLGSGQVGIPPGGTTWSVLSSAMTSSHFRWNQ